MNSNLPASDQRRSSQRRRQGLSLLEVMLAVAILGGALAALGQLVRIGARSSATIRDLTQGQLLCENRLAEIAAGVVPPEPIMQEPAEETSEWLISVDVQPVDDLGLLGVTVLVEQDPNLVARPASVQLTRWMVDPAVDQAAVEEQAARDEAAAAAAQENAASAQSGAQGGDMGGDGQQGGGQQGGNGQGGDGQGGGGQNPTDPNTPQIPGFPPDFPGGGQPNAGGQAGGRPGRGDQGQGGRPGRGGGRNGQPRAR